MTLSLFLWIAAIHLAAAVSPGPSFVVALRVAASEGFKVAAALALGFGLGAALWATAAMTGITLIFELVPALFIALKLIGAAFLLFVAFMMWRHAAEPIDTPNSSAAPRSMAAAVRFGFITFASNPKPAIFFGAIFAGLIPADTTLQWKAAILAAVFINETLWYIFVARILSLPRAQVIYTSAKATIDRFFGTLIALFGLKIATS